MKKEKMLCSEVDDFIFSCGGRGYDYIMNSKILVDFIVSSAYPQFSEQTELSIINPASISMAGVKVIRQEGDPTEFRMMKELAGRRWHKMVDGVRLIFNLPLKYDHGSNNCSVGFSEYIVPWDHLYYNDGIYRYEMTCAYDKMHDRLFIMEK